MVTTENLIRSGYLPVELTPPFSTVTLADALPVITPELNNLKSSSKSKCCVYSIPRVKHTRRLLSIPNPRHQIILCQTLENNWAELEEFFSKSKLSLSTPDTIRGADKRAVVPKYKFDQLPAESVLRSTACRIRLHADISRYYSTIYTHAIPWALHSKPVAKKCRKDEYYGNTIDKCVRNTQDQQTLGIPIGPDTSLIISEIIGTAMDIKLSEKLSANDIKGYRYMDDYFLFFSNFAQAEQAISKLHSVAKYYELELNPNKTELIELPESSFRPWVSELRLHEFRHSSNQGQRNDILNYFDKSFNYSKQYPDDFVLKYSLKRINELNVKYRNWPLYEAFLLKSVILEPSVLPTVFKILISYSNNGYDLNISSISDTISEIITYHSELKHSYEVSWALWLGKNLNISLNKEAATEISKFEDSIVALTALDLKSSELISEGLDTSKWEAFMTAEDLYSDHWILSYEANVKGWLPSSNGEDYVDDDPFFSILKEAGVSFYNITEKETSETLGVECGISAFDSDEYAAWLDMT